jgi:hypothetical protein
MGEWPIQEQFAQLERRFYQISTNLIVFFHLQSCRCDKKMEGIEGMVLEGEYGGVKYVRASLYI